MSDPFKRLQHKLAHYPERDTVAYTMRLMCPMWSREYVDDRSGRSDREVISSKLNDYGNCQLATAMKSFLQSLPL